MNTLKMNIDLAEKKFLARITKACGVKYESNNVQRILCKEGLEFRVYDNHGYWSELANFVGEKLTGKWFTHSTMYDYYPDDF